MTQRSLNHAHHLFFTFSHHNCYKLKEKHSSSFYFFQRNPDEISEFTLWTRTSDSKVGIENIDVHWIKDKEFFCDEFQINIRMINGFLKTHNQHRVFDFETTSFERGNSMWHQLVIQSKGEPWSHERLDFTFDLADCISVDTDKYRKRFNGIQFNVAANKYQIYFVEDLMILESMNQLLFDTFDTDARVILGCFGLATGSVARSEGCYFQFESEQFIAPTTFYFTTSFRANYKSSIRLIHTNVHTHTTEAEKSQITQLEKEVQPLSRSTFSNLCTLVKNNEKIAHAVGLMLDANMSAEETRAILFAVVSEAFASYVGAKREKPLSKKDAKDLQKACHEEASKLIPCYDKNHTIYKKISALNNSTNRDALKAPFLHLGIPITLRDEKALDTRNSFLHGRLPDDVTGDVLSRVGELLKISHRLAFLNHAILLKLCGHTGKILNPIKVFYEPPAGADKEDSFLDIGAR